MADLLGLEGLEGADSGAAPPLLPGELEGLQLEEEYMALVRGGFVNVVLTLVLLHCLARSTF